MIGESANHKVVEDVRRILCDYPMIEHVNEVLTMHMGPKYILSNLSVDFADDVTAVELEQAIAGLDYMTKQTCPDVQRVFIEAEARMLSASEL